MLEKGKGVSKNEFIEILMDKKDKGNECIIRTTKGDFYGRIISVGFDKVSLSQGGKNVDVDIDYILEVE